MGDPPGSAVNSRCRAWLALRETGPAFVALDDPVRLAATGAALGLAVPVRQVDDAADAGRGLSGRAAGAAGAVCGDAGARTP